MNLLEAKIYYDGSNWIAIPPHRAAILAETPKRQTRK